MSDNIVSHFIRTTPVITRVLVALTVLVSSCIYFDFVKPQSISYSRYYLADLQFYRMLTTFFYYGKVSFELIMNFIFLYRYSLMLEESYMRKSDYFYTLVLIFTFLLVISTFLYIPFLATPLSNTLTYIWSRKNPQGIVQIFGFVSFSAFYLPFVFPLISLVFEGRIPKEEAVGIVVGHTIYYLQDVYPRFGKNFGKTPCFLHKLFKETCDSCQVITVNKMAKKVGDFRAYKVSVQETNSQSPLNDKMKESDTRNECSSPCACSHKEKNNTKPSNVLEMQGDNNSNDEFLESSCIEEAVKVACPEEQPYSQFETLKETAQSHDDSSDSIEEIDARDLNVVIQPIQEQPIDFRYYGYSEVQDAGDSLEYDIVSETDYEDIEIDEENEFDEEEELIEAEVDYEDDFVEEDDFECVELEEDAELEHDSNMLVFSNDLQEEHEMNDGFETFELSEDEFNESTGYDLNQKFSDDELPAETQINKKSQLDEKCESNTEKEHEEIESMNSWDSE